ncbi:TRAP transporter small permease [Saccharospirillum impatiens]|uniref:TRAP transporter small permease n=1 Tax=Saccharospirillum impatiens TaxID=169438 RepID=UPI000404EFA5|nr:TRAP transporter small permease [Saccharospirillum impatiens]
MKALVLPLKALMTLNTAIAAVGKFLAWICVTLMVSSILFQVVMRYVFNNAQPWPEEVARAFMMWMMALVAAAAYREGSFVAIEMLHDFLPRVVAALLKLTLYLAALIILYFLFTMGLEFFQRGFRSRAASFNMPLAWVYLAMPVCFGTMILVNIELLLKEAGNLIFSDFNDRLGITPKHGRAELAME